MIASRLLSFLAVALIVSAAWAPTLVQSQIPPPVHTIRLEVFVRNDSELSVQAARFAKELGDRTRGLEVVVHDVIEDRAQLSRLWQLTRQSGRDKPVVPAFHCCDRLYFGFTSTQKTGPLIEDLYTAHVYTRSTCSRCKSAKAFISRLSPRWPALRFRIYEITYDTEARRRYEELCRSRGRIPGLPTLHFAGQVIIGYQGDHITGAQWENLIRRVAGESAGNRNPGAFGRKAPADPPRRDQGTAIQLVGFWASQDPESQQDVPAFDDLPFVDDVPLVDDAQGFDDVPLPDEASNSDLGEAIPLGQDESQSQSQSDIIDVPGFGQLRASDLGLPLFTFLVGLVDGFNPCAMWILVFLLSVLVNIKDRRKILLIAGTFVVVSGLAYFAFMAAWLNLFMLIGIARWAQIILGLLAIMIGVINVKDFFAFKKGVSLSIPESSKPGLYRRVREIVSAQYLTAALAGVIVLAVIVNMIELLCTAGLPALYTQILTMQDLPWWKNYAYLALYISAYMLDDSVLLTIVVVTLSHHKLQEREGRWLKLVSGLVILALGLVMIFKPEWLQLGR
jgi:hypothetical protein